MEDRPLQLAKGRPWLDPQRCDERLSCVPVGLESLRLTARAIEGEDVLAAEALQQRVLGDEELKLTDQLCVAAEGEVGVDAFLHGIEAELLEPTDLGLRPRVEGEVEKRRSPRVQGPSAASAPQPVGRPTRLGHEALEAVGVEAAVLDVELVPRRPRGDRARTERPSELGDVRLQHLRRCGGRTIGPEILDQPVARDRLVRMEQQNREERLGLRRAQRYGVAFGESFERPEDAELHRDSRPNVAPGSRRDERAAPALYRLSTAGGHCCGAARDGGIEMTASLGWRIPARWERRWSVGRRAVAVAAVLVVPTWGARNGGFRRARGRERVEFTGAPQACLVPAGVCRVRIEAVGAAGGERGTAGSPGFGATALATLRVSPGETLLVRVGG